MAIKGKPEETYGFHRGSSPCRRLSRANCHQGNSAKLNSLPSSLPINCPDGNPTRSANGKITRTSINRGTPHASLCLDAHRLD